MPRFQFIYLLLTRYLFIRKSSRLGFIGVIISLALSVVPLVVVQQVVDGMIEGIVSRYVETASYHFRAEAYLREKEDAEIETGIAKIDGVYYVGRELQGYGLLASETSRSAVTIRAIPSKRWELDRGFREYYKIDTGNFTLDEPRSIVLSRELARALDAKVGDRVNLATASIKDSATMLPKLSRFQVSGIVSNGYQELDRYWVYISIEDGERVLSDSEEFIGIKIDHPFSIPNSLIINLIPTPLDKQRQADTVETMENIRRLLPVSWVLIDWHSMEISRYATFRSTRSMLLFLMGIIITVAVMTIISSLIRLVMEQQRDIAMLRCMGCPPSTILTFLISCGITIGFISAFLGISMGLVLALNINEIIAVIDKIVNMGMGLADSMFGIGQQGVFSLLSAEFYLERIPVEPQFFHIFYIVVLVVGLSAISAYIPAKRASKLLPNEVLLRS